MRVELRMCTPLHATQELRRAVNEGGRKVAKSRLFGSFCDGVIEIARMGYNFAVSFGFLFKIVIVVGEMYREETMQLSFASSKKI